MPGVPGRPLASQIFDRSVNPIPTGEGRLSPHITTGTPNVFHLPASLPALRCVLTGGLFLLLGVYFDAALVFVMKF